METADRRWCEDRFEPVFAGSLKIEAICRPVNSGSGEMGHNNQCEHSNEEGKAPGCPISPIFPRDRTGHGDVIDLHNVYIAIEFTLLLSFLSSLANCNN